MKIPFLIGLLLIYVSSLIAQDKKVEVTTGNKAMSQGEQFAISVFIPEAKAADVESLWKKYINNRSVSEKMGNVTTQAGNLFKSKENKVSTQNLKVEKVGDEWIVKSIENNSLGGHSFNIYAKALEIPEGLNFNTFYQFTDSVFLNESNLDRDRMESMKNYLREFGLEGYRAVVDKQILAAEDVVKKQEKVLADIEDAIRKDEKKITGFEADIEEYKAKITLLENDIKLVDEKISAKKLSTSGFVKGTPEYDLAKKELKELDKEHSKVFSDIKSYKEKIKTKEQNIQSSKREIEKNNEKVKQQKALITEKQKITEELNTKKEAIN